VPIWAQMELKYSWLFLTVGYQLFKASLYFSDTGYIITTDIYKNKHFFT
jgi:hypothetical protein